MTQAWYHHGVVPEGDLLLVDIGARSNCEEHCGDYLNVGCVMNPKAYRSLLAHLKESGASIFSDMSSGGHGCLIEVSNEDLLKKMRSTGLSLTEASVLVKFGHAERRDTCRWYRELE